MSSDFVLFAQHGWADTNESIVSLSRTLVTAQNPIIAPDLGWFNTWLRMEPLIQRVEAQAVAVATQYPQRHWRVIGHSMGGLIWVELLHRHPEWWSRLHSLVLVGSPIGGSDLGRLLAPFGLGLTVADDLGVNRRALVEAIATQIPTLVVAGDIDGGSDGTVMLESTKVERATTHILTGISHATLKRHPLVGEAIASFWKQPLIPLAEPPTPSHKLIQKLRRIPGMTDAHYRGAQEGTKIATLEDGSTLRIWTNVLGIPHVFVVSSEEKCLYAGFVGWADSAVFKTTLAEILNPYPNSSINR
ncbi:MAG: alpha/beta hydrolase [Leptolyngbyaceae bacterium]|nr:alpha/beta hydrolase [Leptolyngbyaceae bacterium]